MVTIRFILFEWHSGQILHQFRISKLRTITMTHCVKLGVALLSYPSSKTIFNSRLQEAKLKARAPGINTFQEAARVWVLL